jgi:pimeloyl-ACP methyl ester carboxylesterase/DNA-binding CsgD family transcriptional regulator
MLPGWLSHVRNLWTHPAAASALAKLSATHRFIWYDRLGCGLSDRTGFTPSVANDVAQLGAVLAAIGVERCSLIGYSWAGPAATAFTAANPDRVDRLVLYSTYVRGDALLPKEMHDAFVSLVRSNWALSALTLGTVFVPNASGADLRWFSKFTRDCTTADMAAALLDAMRDHDVRDELTEIRRPTLVLTNQHDPVIAPAHSHAVAALVPGSILHVLEGNEHEPFILDSGSVVEAVLEFVSGRVPVAPLTRQVDPASAALTPRETEVLRLLASGSPNKAIARQLGIAIATVERHVTSVYRKVGARGRADATLAAAGMGLVSVPAAR